MKDVSFFFIMLMIIMFGSISSAETFGYGRTEDIPINYSLIPTVNNSQYWQGYLPSTLPHNLLANLVWSLSGHTIDTNLDMNNNTISEVKSIGFADDLGSINFTGTDNANYRIGRNIGWSSDATFIRNIGIGNNIWTTADDMNDLICIGEDACKTGNDAGNGVFIGSFSGDAITGSQRSTCIGYDTCTGLTYGGDNVAVGENAYSLSRSGSYNTCIGTASCDLMYDSSDFNVCVGRQSCNRLGSSSDKNVFIGAMSGKNIRGDGTDTDENTCVGYYSCGGSADHERSGQVNLGFLSGYTDKGDNVLCIDNSDATTCLLQGNMNTRVLSLGEDGTKVYEGTGTGTTTVTDGDVYSEFNGTDYLKVGSIGTPSYFWSGFLNYFLDSNVFIDGTLQTESNVTMNYKKNVIIATATVNTDFGENSFSVVEDVSPTPLPFDTFSAPYEYFVTFTSGSENGNSFDIVLTFDIGSDFIGVTGGANVNAGETLNIYQRVPTQGVQFNQEIPLLNISVNTTMAGNLNVTNNFAVGGNLGLTTNKLINGTTAQCWLNYTGGILTASNC